MSAARPLKIAIVYGNDGSDVRVAKTCSALVGQGHDVHFVGWDRRPDLAKKSDLPGVQRHVISHQVPQMGSTLSGQWIFFRHAVAMLLRIRPDVVCAVNEDNVLRIGWLKHVAFRRMVCDVFDSHLDKSTGKPWPWRAAVSVLVNVSRRLSDCLIATDEVRFQNFGSFRSKTTVIGNYPPDPGPELSRKIPQGAPSIFVSGTLSRTRGLDTLLEALSLVSGVRVVAAGWAADEFAEQTFLRHPAVQFVGHVTPRQSLELAAESDAVLAMYAPLNRNQILASPNKIYDALSVGRPVIINSEARVSEWVVKQGIGFAAPYADARSLAGFLGQLPDRRETLPESARRARELFVSGYHWGAMEERLERLYSGLFPAGSCTTDLPETLRKAA